MIDLVTLQRQFYRAVVHGVEQDIIKQVRTGPLLPREQLQIDHRTAAFCLT